MTYKHPGHTKPKVKAAGLKALVLAGVIPPKKQRKKRQKETKPRNREEDKIRTEIIKVLRQKNVYVRRLEPSTRGKFGVSDLLVINKNKLLFVFVEVKSPKGQLSETQREFRDLCLICNVKYIVIRSVDEAKEKLL